MVLVCFVCGCGFVVLVIVADWIVHSFGWFGLIWFGCLHGFAWVGWCWLNCFDTHLTALRFACLVGEG